MNNYEEFLANLDRKAYHEGEFSWEEDGFEVYRMHPWTPPGCHDSCGCILYLKDGKLDHVEGDPLAPYNGGKLCMRCLDLPEATNHPARLKYPMKRKTWSSEEPHLEMRGKDEWVRISWDEAIDLIAERIDYFTDKYGVQSINVSRGTGRDVSWGSGFLAYVGIQTPHQDIMFNIAWSCYTPRTLTSNVILGDYWVADASCNRKDRYADPEWRAPGVVIIWANEPLKSNGDGYLGHWLVECVQLGTKIITVDPRLTWWGARSEYWLQIRSGSDAACAMGMLNVITTEDLYDHEFVANWCYGFEQMCAAVAEWTPERVAEECGIDADDLRGAARLFATEGPGAVQWGLPLEQCPGSLGANLAILSLISICGYIDCPGGNVFVRDAYGFPHHIMEGYCPAENLALRCQKPGPGAIWGETRQLYWDWEQHAPHRVRMLIAESCNTLGNCSGGVTRIFDTMKELEFVVGVDPFLNGTLSAFADILLPVAMNIERDSIRSWWTPLRFTAKITQYEEAKPDEEIAILLTHKLGRYDIGDMWTAKDLQNWRLSGQDEFKNAGGVDANIEEAKGNKGGTFSAVQNQYVLSNEKWDPSIDFDAFKQMGWAYDHFCGTYYKYQKGMLRDDGQPGFKTTTGRIELYSLSYQAWGVPPVPEYIAPEVKTSEKYPYYMNSGVRSWEFFHGEHRMLPTMREFHPWPEVWMNESVAEKHGIKNGEWTWIENDEGRFKQVAHVVPDGFLRDDCITTEAGWWYPEDDPAYPTFFRTFDSNPNVCIDIDQVGPYGIGSYTKCTPVTVYPVKEGDITPTQQVVELGGFPKQKARREAYQAEWKAKGIENN